MTYLTQQLADIRTKLNYYRRLEARLKKDIQKMCRHSAVKYAHKLPKLSAFDPYASPLTTVKVRVYCRDCGKRLG